MTTIIRISALFLILAIAAFTTTPTAFAKDPVVIYDEVNLEEGGKLSRVTIIDETGDSASEGFSPALDTIGSANVQRVTIHNAGVGVRASSGSLPKAKFQFMRNRVIGEGNSIGLLLDVRTTSKLQVTNNVFEKQRCGISVSIDVIFHDLPSEERMTAFASLARELEKNNTFINVEQPVCGGRG